MSQAGRLELMSRHTARRSGCAEDFLKGRYRPVLLVLFHSRPCVRMDVWGTLTAAPPIEARS